jgi:8-oxo-dGTP pyrophosphatase MutT (NUDIX family)
MEKDWVTRLIAELAGPLPGVEAQLRLSPPERRMVEPGTRKRKSAVLFVLYPVQEKVYTVFIKRSEYNGIHSGQVGLPGGMYKRTDCTLLNTALRETMEETGIPEHEIAVAGNLTPLHIPVSNIQVFPFVGICQTKPEMKHDPREVSYLIECSMNELTDPGNQKHKNMYIGEREIIIPYYDIRGDHIWGATAMIVSEFTEIFKRVFEVHLFNKP